MYASIFSLVGFGGLGFGVWALVSGLWMSGFGFLALVGTVNYYFDLINSEVLIGGER